MVSVAESTMEEIPLGEEESSMEYRMLMAYAQRTLPASKFAHLMKPATPRAENVTAGNGKKSKAATNGTLPHEKHKKKKKSLRKKLIPKCLRPAMGEKEHQCDERDGRSSEERNIQTIAHRLHGIIRKIKTQEAQSEFRNLRRASSVQVDGEDEDELIANIVQILRSTGDQLNDQISKDRSLLERVQSLWSYSFYSKITDFFLSDTIAESEPEEEQQINRIALCVHATAALTTLASQPMNRVLGFGERYLKENYSHWIQSHGGLEAVMGIQDGEEVE